MATLGRGYRTPLSCDAFAMQCPVLRKHSNPLLCYACNVYCPATGETKGPAKLPLQVDYAIGLRACYAMPGTD
eukprot:1477059-Rhodomonas_salina.2